MGPAGPAQRWGNRPVLLWIAKILSAALQADGETRSPLLRASSISVGHNAGMDLTQLTAVKRREYWAVRITWPNGKKHYLGEHKSEREANEWIKQHRRLTAKKSEEKDLVGRVWP